MMLPVTIQGNGWLRIIRLMSEASGALQALGLGPDPLTDSQKKAIADLRKRLEACLNDIMTDAEVKE